MSLRISVTQLESFRLFRESEWFTLEKLIQDLTSRFEPTLQMQFGTAYHRLIELGQELPNAIRTDSSETAVVFPLKDELALPALQFADEHPDISNELKITKHYEVDGDPVTLVAKVDGLEGLMIHEHKTSPDVSYDKYFKSYQWRYYMDMFDLPKVQYNAFELGATKFRLQEALTPDEFTGSLKYIKPHTYVFDTYANLHSDCMELLNEFVFFIKNQNLEYVFERTGTPAMAMTL